MPAFPDAARYSRAGVCKPPKKEPAGGGLRGAARSMVIWAQRMVWESVSSGFSCGGICRRWRTIEHVGRRGFWLATLHGGWRAGSDSDRASRGIAGVGPAMLTLRFSMSVLRWPHGVNPDHHG